MSLVSINAINSKIVDTKEEIAIYKQGPPESVMHQFMISELKRRLEALEDERREIMESQSKETVSLRIYGERIVTGKISNRLLISVLNGFQAMVDSIAQTLDGAEGKRGKFTDRAKTLTDFQVTGTFEGSFGIVLEKNYEQIEMLSGSSETTQILDEFFGILENSEISQRLIEQISPFGERAVNHYKNWLKNLVESGVNVEIDWKDENAQNRRINIEHLRMKDAIFTLESIDNIETQDIELIDVSLTGLNIRNNTFELKTNEGTIIKGKSKTEVLISLSEQLGKNINVRLTKSISSIQANIKKESWYLVDKF